MPFFKHILEALTPSGDRRRRTTGVREQESAIIPIQAAPITPCLSIQPAALPSSSANANERAGLPQFHPLLESNNVLITDGEFNQIHGHQANVVIHINQSSSGSPSGPPPDPPSSNDTYYINPTPSSSQSTQPNYERVSLQTQEIPLQKSNDIYERHLTPKGRGFPLWIPGPNQVLHINYRRTGMRIGDVGIITHSGGFSFLFNICLPHNDPVNPRVLPEHFAPISPPIEATDVDEFLAFENGSHLASASINRLGTGIGISFESSASEGAILTMPRGARSVDLGNFARFREYAAANVADWYKFVNGPRGREAKNGDLRLVVGFDSTTSWGMATFANQTKQNNCRLSFRPLEGATPPSTYAWEYSGAAEVRAGPDSNQNDRLRMDSDPPDVQFENQCLFMRTLNITLADSFWADIHSSLGSVHVDSRNSQKYPPVKDYSSNHPNNLGTSSSSNFLSSQGLQSGTQRTASPLYGPNVGVRLYDNPTMFISGPPGRIMVHPSKVLNDILLAKIPTAKMVITHDNDWSLFITQYDTLPDLHEFAMNILSSQNICEENGVIFLQPKETLNEVLAGSTPVNPAQGPPLLGRRPLISAIHRTLLRSRNLFAPNPSSLGSSAIRSQPAALTETNTIQAPSYQAPLASAPSITIITLPSPPALNVQHRTQPGPSPQASLDSTSDLEGLGFDSTDLGEPPPYTPFWEMTNEVDPSQAFQAMQPSANLSRSGSSASSRKATTILALVIGINKYASPTASCLEGAVGDADAFENFLKERLNVPDANIISLRDEQASRLSILSAFESLKDNMNYKRDEAAIIIYFAGHGAQIDKPEEWQDWVTSGERIEMLCPSDIGCPILVDGEETGDVVPAIPDRTISVLLDHISDVKGNNITLILDCCSSAGINRGEEDFEEPGKYLIRQISNPPQFKNDIDKELLSHGTKSDNVGDGFCGKFHTSHVLLAACGRDQVAREHPETKRGIFTYNLMKVLTGNDVNTLTYTSLIHKMEMPKWQTPHCGGQGVYRRLFNNRTSGADSSFILAKREQGQTRIILEAGAAQGITVGSRMAVHVSNLLATASTPNPCLGYLTVTSVGPFTCVLQVPSDTEDFQVPVLFYCLVEYRAPQKIALYCEDRPWLETIFPPEKNNQLSITIVNDVQSCDLQLTVIGSKVHFDRHNVLVTPHIGARIPHTIDADDVPAIWNVVKSSLHFYHYLIRRGGGGFQDVQDVWMELKKLENEQRDDLDPVFTPTGKNLIADEPATIVVDEFALLGMTIFNRSGLSLYPYLFYFDPTDLTIIEWYTPPFGAGLGRQTIGVDVPLPSKSKLAIGYGDGGVAPWQFRFREGEKQDIGFFKLFLSTRPTQFSSILQESPFAIGMSRADKPDVPDIPDVELWGTKLATVIQVDS